METGWPNCPRYFRNNYENLKTKFTGAENIENNWSQSMQDMFVLSMLDGKRNGVYVEIGADQPRVISNTYLLENNFDWSGVSFELDADKVTYFNSIRKNKINVSLKTLLYMITNLFLRNVIIQSK